MYQDSCVCMYQKNKVKLMEAGGNVLMEKLTSPGASDWLDSGAP